MQNRAMIEEERALMEPLVEQLTQGQEPDLAESMAGTILNAAVSLRRGLACGRGVSGLCVNCVEVGATDTPICDYRIERGATVSRAEERRLIRQSVHVPGTTLFTVDV